MADQQQPQQKGMNTVHAGGLDLPPGFRFHPSDYEIVSHYLTNKVRNMDLTYTAFEEVDLKKTEPWNLPIKAKWGEKEWYFFYLKDRKYSTGLRANRATKAGYWKATGKDKEVYNTIEGVVVLVGMKKTLVFYKGKAPRGDKTNWVMHEYRLEGSNSLSSPASTSNSAANVVTTMKASASAFKDEWVVCRVFEKTIGIKKTAAPAYQVAMDGAEIDQRNINPTIPIPMPVQLPLSMSMPMQFPGLPDFTMDLMPPCYPNTSAEMSPMVGIGGGLQINDALFDNSIAALPQMNFYNQMGMEATADQMDMGVVADQMGKGGFESRPFSMVLERDEQANATEISSMLSMTGLGSVTTTIEMNDTWKYKY
ncbi:hypothetical protein BDA96_05G204400 [Sorghum bicolor]|uniref:NAC domain-containing protein n=1 Tax=Sorghum bicolor TaxID=4558 RepID=A0A921QZ55_SORBI|nr:hypothetical protein BDA96_05G204400 [Sorghum bicolor]